MTSAGGSGVQWDQDQGWYGSVTGPMEQGDIFLDFPLVLPTLTSDGQMVLSTANHIVLVLTQTCDIPKTSQKTLLLVQAVNYDSARRISANGHLNSQEYREALANGTSIADFLLPPSEDGHLEFTLVHFRNLFVLPKNYVERYAPDRHRLRLRSPYKEYFSQAYARFIMRVGLPSTLHSFTSETVAKI